MTTPVAQPKHRGLLALLALYLVLTGAVVMIRLAFLVTMGDMVEVTGVEQCHVYAIWRVLNDKPLYGQPLAFPYDFSQYNYLFYFSYAGTLKFLGTRATELLTTARALTCGFALTGAGASWLLVRRLRQCRLQGRIDLLFGLVLLAAWTGPAVAGWWAFTVRPDIGAVALSVVALRILLAALDRPSYGLTVLASGVFYLSWGFKQSSFCILLGATVALLWSGRRTFAAAVFVPFCSAVALTLAAGTPEYRFAILRLPGIGEWMFRCLVSGGGAAALTSLLAYLLATVTLMRSWMSGLDLETKIMGVALILSTVICTAQLALNGSARNLLFDSMMLAWILCGVELSRWFGSNAFQPIRGLVPLSMVALLASIAVPAIHLLRPAHFLRATYAALVPGDAALTARKRTFATAVLARLPKPIYLEEPILSLPWFCNGDSYPAPVFDWVKYPILEMRGLLTDGGLKQRIQEKYYQVLVIGPNNPLASLALANGYVCVTLSPAARIAGTGRNGPQLVLYARPGLRLDQIPGLPVLPQ